MQIFPFNGLIPDLKKIKFDDDFYEKLREEFNSLLRDHAFKKVSSKDCFYILEIKQGKRVSTGLIALTDINEYKKTRVRKHENTIIKKERLLQKLLKDRKAMIKPAALLISHHNTLHELLYAFKYENNPVLKVSFPDKKTIHKIWKMEDEKLISTITLIFRKEIKNAIIADGHHRFASMASMALPSPVLSVFFDPDQMQIDSFLRIIKPRKDQSHAKVISQLKKISSKWEKVDKLISSSDSIQLIFNEERYQFQLSGKQLIPFLFSKKVSKSTFEIENESNNKRINFLDMPSNESEIEMLQVKYAGHYIFILPPLNTTQVLVNKKLLPPKSTQFLPRIINGLIIKLL